MLLLIYRISMLKKKTDTDKLACKTETDSQNMNLGFPEGRTDWEFKLHMYTLLCLKQMTHKKLLSQ